MIEDLYFIPSIIGAWRQPERKSAIVDALVEIARRGQQPRYRRGYRQFLDWMQVVAAASADMDALDIATEMPSSTVQPGSPTFCLYHDDRLIAVLSPQRGEDPLTVDRVQSGRYRLVFETGWVVWEKTLIETDLLWKFVPMAADDGRPGALPAQECPLLDGCLVIRVYPGLGAAQLTLQLAPGEERR